MDKSIIQRAQKMKCYQEVDMLRDKTKCPKTLEKLQDISRRLYLKEERFANISN